MKSKILIFKFIKIMRKTEVYQIRLDSQEKKQAFAVFKQLGITPAQAVRLFFKLRRLKQEQKTAAVTHESNDSSNSIQHNDEFLIDDDHLDLFEELNAILGEGDKN